MIKFIKSLFSDQDIIFAHDIDIQKMSNKELIVLLKTDKCSLNTGHAIVTLILDRLVNAHDD